MGTAKVCHKDEIARCRFSVVPGDGSALLGMPDTELFSILKIMCDVIEGQKADMKCDSQTREPSSTLSYKANTVRKSRAGNGDVINSP